MLIVVRHGRTEANASGLLLGRADPALDDVGERQASALGAALAGDAVARVVTSPLRRARQTGAAIAAATGVADVEVDERWIELDYGDLDGHPVGDVPAEVWEAWRTDPDFAPPGGESLRALRARIDEVCMALLAEAAAHEHDTVVVTHVSPIKAALGWALDAPEHVNWRAFVAPASVTRIDLRRGGGPVLVSFNETAHLDA